jgi:hypothetical protein
MSSQPPASEHSAFARPPVFSDDPFAEALARAATERRWLLVYLVDASKPESWADVYTTWRDTSVVGWLEKYAIAIQVDALADAETTRTLGVNAASAPTVILYRDGKERVRIPGRARKGCCSSWYKSTSPRTTSRSNVRC